MGFEVQGLGKPLIESLGFRPYHIGVYGSGILISARLVLSGPTSTVPRLIIG